MFEPVLVFDSRERWFPVGVEESLEPHGYEWSDNWHSWAKNKSVVSRLDFPPDMVQPDLPPVGYRRQLERAGVTWHQFWLWFMYNPKEYAGFGKHEGDWEFCQVGAVDDTAVVMTLSQHQTGGKREWWGVDLRAGRPVVHVARDSHAMYFDPPRNFEDVSDGEGRVLDSVEWRDFGDWKDWRGRWGNSTEQGKSPESPGRQGVRWREPQLFHLRARQQ
jgi:hypothetical protein